MQALIGVALAGCCVFGGILAMAGEGEGQANPSELLALKAQLTSLEARVSALESRFHVIQRNPNVPIRPRWLHGRPVPDSWSRREFNGMPYYVIPLGGDPNRGR